MTYPQYPHQPDHNQYPGYPQVPVQQQVPGYPQAVVPQQYPGYPQFPGQPPFPLVPRPDTHMGLAIVGLIFCWPIGLPAVLNAAKVDSMYFAGRWADAHVYSQRAKNCANWAIGVGIALGVVYFLLRTVIEVSYS